MSQISLIVIFLCALTWLVPMESDMEPQPVSQVSTLTAPATTIIHDESAVRQNNGPITMSAEEGEPK
jgi:hypothetical protein